MSLPPETSTVSLLPPQSPDEDRGLRSKLRASSKTDGGCFAGSGRRRIKHLKDSRAPQSGALSQGYVPELSAKESLRWEGVLEDPQAEEKRLELYRAKRRQRYIAHREALLKETQGSLKQTFLKKSTEVKADQQVTPLLLHLSIDWVKEAGRLHLLMLYTDEVGLDAFVGALEDFVLCF